MSSVTTPSGRVLEVTTPEMLEQFRRGRKFRQRVALGILTVLMAALVVGVVVIGIHKSKLHVRIDSNREAIATYTTLAQQCEDRLLQLLNEQLDSGKATDVKAVQAEIKQLQNRIANRNSLPN